MSSDLYPPDQPHEWCEWFEDTGLLHRFCVNCDAEQWKDREVSP